MRLFFCSVLLLMTVASGKRLEADTESVTAGAAPPSSGKGDGVYLQKPFSSSLSREAQANNITNPYVDGTAASFSWSELEPTEGDFQWRIVEETIQPWAAAGKKVILGVHTGTVGTIGRKVKQATPEWVFSSGARKMKVPDGTILPIYWDPIYFEKYRNFVKAFAKKYDGDPRIEFIRIGVGVWGELVVERWFPRPENAEMRERWKKAGYDPERWIQTIEKTMEMYREAFQKTPCAIMLAGIFGDRDGIFRIADRAVELGFYLEQNGLKANWQQSLHQSPISRIFQKYQGKTKLILETWGDSRRKEVFKTGEVAVQGSLLSTVIVGNNYGADYLLIYPTDIAKGDKRNSKLYDPSHDVALRYAKEKLKEKRSR